MIMRLRNIILVMMVLVVLVESRPNASNGKYKRAVPISVHRPVPSFDKQHSDQRTIDDEGQHRDTINWESRSQAIKKLLNVLGLDAHENFTKLVARQKTRKPPKYMTDLYKAIADDDGVTRDPGLLSADTVRSIPNKGAAGTNVCQFDVKVLSDTEIVVDAELHLFQSQKLSRRLAEAPSPTRPVKPVATTRPTNFIIKIYQILSRTNDTETRTKLVSARRLHIHHSGWHVFSILPTVKQWISSASSNYGLAIEIITSEGQIIENTPERESLQPILVIFTNNTAAGYNEKALISKSNSSTESNHNNLRKPSDDEKHKNLHERNKRSASRNRNNPARQHNGYLNRRGRKWSKNDYTSPSRSSYELSENGMMAIPGSTYHYRHGVVGNQKQANEVDNSNVERDEQDANYFSDEGRSAGGKSYGKAQYAASMRASSFTSNGDPAKMIRNCRRYPLYVNFEDMGWSGWIIHPRGYNAYHCKGLCPFPLGQQLNPTNHATVQSIMHTLGLGDQIVDMPCCVPDKLYDINLLYFDENDYVVIRRYKDMVATSCSCR